MPRSYARRAEASKAPQPARLRFLAPSREIMMMLRRPHGPMLDGDVRLRRPLPGGTWADAGARLIGIAPILELAAARFHAGLAVRCCSMRKSLPPRPASRARRPATRSTVR